MAGAVMLLGSFLPFYSVSGNEFVRDTDWSAWSNAFSLFPLTVFVMLYGVIAAVHVALSRFAGTDLPNRILGFTWPQLHLVLGFLATLTMLAYLIRGGEITEDVDRGIGFWLMLLGAIGVLVGAVMEQQQSAPADGRFGDAR